MPGPWPVSSVPDAVLISMPLSPLLNTPPTPHSITVSLRGWMSSFLCILPNLRPPKKRRVVLGDSEKAPPSAQMALLKGAGKKPLVPAECLPVTFHRHL